MASARPRHALIAPIAAEKDQRCMIPFPRFPDGPEGLRHGFGQREAARLRSWSPGACDASRIGRPRLRGRRWIGLVAILRLEHQTRRKRAVYHLTFTL